MDDELSETKNDEQTIPEIEIDTQDTLESFYGPIQIKPKKMITLKKKMD